ncbi:hypothetical protein [Aquimarina muelleri]|uniref:Uncharacterized protein n=1 Tax=Aquimarina muelleri TaxID=279356 RepID=A0A918JRX5_9FLAO|nr:hypothetical protein [Aquimarina muelleri]MCX2763024.1 hypothetical protein [Aquimarina muelleri]GGX03376.1 hypothetical protein GCM10007384_01400 [Aquimarina muelleri]
MTYSKIIPFIFIFIFFIQCSKNNNEKNLLQASDNWRSEVIKFPLDFATSLQYSGIEYIRFAPGWGKENAMDYFSYVFLWQIDQNPQLSTQKLESEMELYFNGLMNTAPVTESNKFKVPHQSKAFFEKVNDSVYVGKIITHDAFTTKKELNLNIIIDYKFCNKTKKHLVLFNVSPKPLEHQIWKKLNKIVINTDC